jgi:RNA polymerase sigma factor FliA
LSNVVHTDPPEVIERFNEQLELVNLIAHQVSRSVGRYVEWDDLVNDGREGLLLAARRFDPSRGVPFRAYANFRVHGAMIDGVRRMSFLPRRALERLAALAAANRAGEGQLEPTFRAADADPGQAEATLIEQLALTATACAFGMVAPWLDGKAEQLAGADPETPEAQLARAELLAHIQRVISELEVKREADILRLHYFENQPLDAIAQELELDKSWISRLHARAMDRVTKRMRNLV